MANFDISVTANGIELITTALSGGTITFTNMQLGSGIYNGAISSAESLVEPKVTLPVDKIIRKENEATAKSVLEFKTIESGFNWTEIGLFAKNPSGGNDILYAYGYAGVEGEYIPGKNDATLNEKVIRLTVVVNDTINVTVETNSQIYVSQEDFESVAKGIVVTLNHAKEGTVHVFTGLEGKTGLIPCQFKSTDSYTDGDTATIDGEAYTIVLTSADEPETDLFITGRSIIVDVDTDAKTINFKAGGGLTKAKLALADATEDTVFNGRTFYAGDKVLRTGRALATPTTVDTSKMFTGVTAYNQQGQLITGNPTASTATAADILKGKKAYNNSGKLMNGTLLKSGTLISTVPQTLSNITSNGSPYTLTFTPPNGTHLVVFDQVGEYITGWGEESALGGVIIDLGGTNKQISGAQITWSSLGSGGSIYTTFDISTISTSSIKVKIAVKPQNQYYEYDVAWLTVTGYFYA